MKVFNKYIYLAVLFLGLLSCQKEDSSDVNPDVPIYQDLKVVYDNYNSETKALATFREGDEDGSRLILNDGASIFINDNKVEYSSNVTNYFYKTIFDNIIDVNFNFTKNNGDSFSNTVSIVDRPDLVMTNSIDTVKLDGSSKVYWQSGELQNNESISFSIHQGSKTGGAGYHSKPGTTYVELGSIIVNDLTEGAAELDIGREKIIEELDQGDKSISNGRYVIETRIVHNIYLKN
jgi:hypothetical protein